MEKSRRSDASCVRQLICMSLDNHCIFIEKKIGRSATSSAFVRHVDELNSNENYHCATSHVPPCFAEDFFQSSTSSSSISPHLVSGPVTL